MYVIKKTRNDGTVQYVSSIKISTNGANIKYHSNPRCVMVFSDMMTAKALVQLAGVAFASTIKIVDFESCFNATNSNVEFAGKRFDELSVGDIMRWANIVWEVVKKDQESAKVYFMTRFCLGDTPYTKPTYNAKSHYVDNTGTDFRRSNLFTLCKYMHKSLESEPEFNRLVRTQSGFNVGVMTKEMLESIPKEPRSANYAYWTSTANSSSDVDEVWFVASGGILNTYDADEVLGFRPYICVNMGGK
nr:MAG TPA: hypothetical protein [Caudoviricetes sp.]